MPKISVVQTMRGRGYFHTWKTMLNGADEIIPSMENLVYPKQHYVACNKAIAATTGDWILFCGERQVFVPDWRERLSVVPADFSGMIRLYPGGDMQAGIITRDFMNELGYFFHPDYIHYWADVELADLAKGRIFELNLVLETIPKEDAQSCEYYDWDKETYQQRRAAGFPKAVAGRNKFYA